MSSLETVEHKLWVVESNGAPRTGKGTITSGMADAFLGAAQDETGADYRAMTYGLLNEEHIEEDMTTEEIGQVIGTLDPAELTSFAARRYEIERDELYTSRISGTVSKVSPHDAIRDPLKKGFANRVERFVADEDTHILFVDGRNLGPIIQKVTGANLLLRLYVDCQPYVAAHREAARSPEVDELSPEEFEEWYKQQVESIRKRKQEDEARPVDPLKIDENAINYWYNNDVAQETGQRIAQNYGSLPFSRVMRMLSTGQDDDYRVSGRYGAGAKAAAEGRQVYFDTTEIGKDTMLSHAHRMVEEALAQNAGRYVPYHQDLIRTA